MTCLQKIRYNTSMPNPFKKSSQINKNLYGSARFATEKEILKAGFLVKNKDKKEHKWDRELIVGTWKEQDLVVCGGDQFVSFAAPIGTNKNESFIIPNCLNYQHNLVVNDPSGKHRQLATRYREDIMGQDVFIFEPFSDKTHHYNPFHYIDFDPKNTSFYGQVDTLARFFFPKELDATELSLHMTRSLFNILLHVYRDLRHTENGKRFCKEHKLNIPKTPTCHFIGSLVNGFKIPGKCADLIPSIDLLYEKNILTKNTIEYWQRSKGMYDASNLSNAQKRYTDVFEIFNDPNLRRFTESNDLDFRDLRRKKVDVFFTISPNDQSRAGLITQLFFSSLIIENLNQTPIPRRVCCMLMDEFDKLGYLDIFARFVGGLGNEGASPTMASYDMRMVMIYSNDAQLEKDQPLGYGKDKAECLRMNCGCSIHYGQQSTEFEKDAEELSDALGTFTGEKITEIFDHNGNLAKTTKELVPRKLMTPEEIMQLGDDLIFFSNASHPIKTRKAFYYEDTYFTDRLLEVSPYLRSKYKMGELPKLEDIKKASQKGELDCKFKRSPRLEGEETLGLSSLGKSDSSGNAIFTRDEMSVYEIKKRTDSSIEGIVLGARSQVWSLQQRSRFIESILLGMPMPALYLSESNGFLRIAKQFVDRVVPESENILMSAEKIEKTKKKELEECVFGAYRSCTKHIVKIILKSQENTLRREGNIEQIGDDLVSDIARELIKIGSSFGVMDGWQRLACICDFLEGKFALETLELLPHINGKKFSQLQAFMQNKIEDRIFMVHTLPVSIPDRIKFDLLKRLNKTPLNNQEMREILYAGPFIQVLESSCQLKSFQKLVGQHMDTKRAQDKYLILRSFALALLRNIYFFKYTNMDDLMGVMSGFLNDTLNALPLVVQMLQKKFPSLEVAEKIRRKVGGFDNLQKALIQDLIGDFKRVMDHLADNYDDSIFRFNPIKSEKRSINMVLFECIVHLCKQMENERISLEAINQLKDRLRDKFDRPNEQLLDVDSVENLRFRFDEIDKILERKRT